MAYRFSLRTRTHRVLFATLVVALCLPGARAELVPGIDSARVVIADRSERTLAEARVAGLAEVIVKLTGDRRSLEQEQVKAALDQAEAYLVQYSYEDGEDSELLLRLEYDGGALRQLLTRAGQPLWTANRPIVLAWLVYNDGQRRVFASADGSPVLRSELRREFTRRGLPLQQPLYDLADRASLSPGAAWRQSSAALTSASARYGDVELLAGRVARLANGSWIGDWQILDGGRWVSRPVSARTHAEFVSAGADLAAATLSARYAVVGGEGGDLRYRVSVAGVDSFAEFSAVRALLEGLEGVQRVQPETVEPQRVVLRLESGADLAQLARIIELDPRFIRERMLPSDGALDYRWEG